jgi:hypothetical protein
VDCQIRCSQFCETHVSLRWPIVRIRSMIWWRSLNSKISGHATLREKVSWLCSVVSGI